MEMRIMGVKARTRFIPCTEAGEAVKSLPKKPKRLERFSK